jgi:hypothetical protein
LNVNFQRILEGLTHILGSFHSLSTFDISSTSMNALAHDNATNELSLCLSWSGVCPSLKRIVFPSKNEWLIGDNYMWVLSGAYICCLCHLPPFAYNK